MSTEDLQIYRIILDAINAFGVIGLLVFLLIAFYKGNIVSKNVVDDIVVSLSTQIMNKIDERIESNKPKRLW